MEDAMHPPAPANINATNGRQLKPKRSNLKTNVGINATPAMPNAVIPIEMNSVNQHDRLKLRIFIKLGCFRQWRNAIAKIATHIGSVGTKIKINMHILWITWG